MWKRNLDDERIIALDDMPGWGNVVADTSSEGAIVAPTAIPVAKYAGVSDKLNIRLSGNTLEIDVSGNTTASIALFDLLGHKVATLVRGNVPAGSTQFDLQGIASGNYVVRARIGGANYAQKIRVK
jgi:mannan endo-1,4-beta-mannosidase